jgi:hypothetical protein
MTPVNNPVPPSPWGWTAATDAARVKLQVFDLSVNDGKDLFYNANQ